MSRRVQGRCCQVLLSPALGTRALVGAERSRAVGLRSREVGLGGRRVTLRRNAGRWRVEVRLAKLGRRVRWGLWRRAVLCQYRTGRDSAMDLSDNTDSAGKAYVLGHTAGELRRL